MDKTAETLKAQIDANVKASTDKNANYAQELVDARVDDTEKPMARQATMSEPSAECVPCRMS